MPQKMNTELQLLRLLSNSPLQTEVTFLRLGTHHYRNISEAYLMSYYKAFSDIQEKYFDGLIITGAPVETLPYEEVDYWKELTGIMKWSEEHVTSFHVYLLGGAGRPLFSLWHSEVSFEGRNSPGSIRTGSCARMMTRGLMMYSMRPLKAPGVPFIRYQTSGTQNSGRIPCCRRLSDS